LPFDQNLEWLGGEMITTTKTECRRAMHCPVLISIVVRILHCQFTILTSYFSEIIKSKPEI